jgi:hypothetical protein
MYSMWSIRINKNLIKKIQIYDKNIYHLFNLSIKKILNIFDF